MFATIVNAVAILLGGTIGLLIKKGIKENIIQAVDKAEGISIFLIGITGIITSGMLVDMETGALGFGGSLLLLLSLVFGVAIGEALRIDDRLHSWGKRVESRFKTSDLAEGFISGSIIMCMGAMSILGSFNAGLRGDYSLLFLKSALDAVTAMVIASTLGYGVLLSAVSILVYQGVLTLCAGFLSPVLTETLINEICVVGYAIVMIIGLNFLKLTNIKTANFLPALLGPVVWRLLLSFF